MPSCVHDLVCRWEETKHGAQQDAEREQKEEEQKGSPRDAGKPGFFLALESNFLHRAKLARRRRSCSEGSAIENMQGTLPESFLTCK